MHAPVRSTLRFDSPILVFGGSYSNLEATSALIELARQRGIAPGNVICTGDVVAYGADPIATVDLVREAGIHVVMGNCEESLANSMQDCGCGFTPGSDCDRLAVSWFQYADRHIDGDARRWMAQLPRCLQIEIGEVRLAVVHGGSSAINQFIFASTDAIVKQRELSDLGMDGILSGHCGIPFTQSLDGRLWHNAGAIGMPANDGTPFGWFSIISPADTGLAIAHEPLVYDYRASAKKMIAAGLPEEYAKALVTGLWPSYDVLPSAEINQTGVALHGGRTLWIKPDSDQLRSKRKSKILAQTLWPDGDRDSRPRLKQGKFCNPDFTASGEQRARVNLISLQTLWINTGTLCNIACRNCYIESSPRNDRLEYLRFPEVMRYLDEIDREHLSTSEIGFTGGEPFMNPDFMDILHATLNRGYRALVLTNAMQPMQRHATRLLDFQRQFRDKLAVRVSLDHFKQERHEEERGIGSFQPTLKGLIWLSENDFNLSAAGRTMWREDETHVRDGFARLFAGHGIKIDTLDPSRLVLFPEMDPLIDVPEITTSCWSILGKSPLEPMCATSRMLVKRKGSASPSVVACTLLPYERAFELGTTLQEAKKPVSLNHPHCARFCVLGGASCTKGNLRIAMDTTL